MMDPVSIFALVSGSASLISQCASAINSFNGIARKYKQAELTKLSMIQEVDIIELAWNQSRNGLRAIQKLALTWSFSRD